MFENAELIHRYTRADALRDGVLIDVSATAREAGFKYPVALTAAAWVKCVAVPSGVLCQDEAGRLWDVLTMLRCAVRGQRGGAARCASASTSATTTASAPRRWCASRRCAAPATTASPSSPSCCPTRTERAPCGRDGAGREGCSRPAPSSLGYSSGMASSLSRIAVSCLPGTNPPNVNGSPWRNS